MKWKNDSNYPMQGDNVWVAIEMDEAASNEEKNSNIKEDINKLLHSEAQYC